MLCITFLPDTIGAEPGDSHLDAHLTRSDELPKKHSEVPGDKNSSTSGQSCLSVETSYSMSDGICNSESLDVHDYLKDGRIVSGVDSSGAPCGFDGYHTPDNSSQYSTSACDTDPYEDGYRIESGYDT